MVNGKSRIPDLLDKHGATILESWTKAHAPVLGTRLDEAELREHSRRFLGLLTQAATAGGVEDVTTAPWADVRAMLESLSRTWASVRAVSPGPGRGATFTVHLPLLAVAETISTAPARPAPSCPRRRRSPGSGCWWSTTSPTPGPS